MSADQCDEKSQAPRLPFSLSPRLLGSSARRLTSSHVAAAAFLAFVFLYLSLDKVWHTDVWAHLRFGEYMVTEGRLPEREMFSRDFADQERPYLNFQWLTQLVGYLVYELGARLAGGNAERQLAGGALALATEHALLVTLRLLVTLLVFRRLTGSLDAALVGVVLVLAFGLEHVFVHRPQALGELWFALLFLALTPKAGSDAVLSRSGLVLVPLVMIAWANCHGSFPVGFVVLGAFAAGRAISLIVGKTANCRWPMANLPLALSQSVRAWWRDPALQRLVFAIGISFAAVAVLNPHGPRLFAYSLEMSAHPNIKYMEEWKPLPVKSTAGYLFLASVLLLVPLLRLSPRQFTPTQVLLLVGFGLQTLSHWRVMVWWGFVVVWVALPHLQALHARARKRAPVGRPVFARILAVVALLLLGLRLATVDFELRADQRLTDATPWKVADDLRREYAKDPTLKRCVFTSETEGDYLFWALRLDPPVRVFCYTHVHLLTEKHWKECMQVKFADADWEEVLNRHGVQFLVVENMPLYEPLMEAVRAAASRWRVVEEAPVFVAKRR